MVIQVVVQNAGRYARQTSCPSSRESITGVINRITILTIISIINRIIILTRLSKLRNQCRHMIYIFLIIGIRRVYFREEEIFHVIEKFLERTLGFFFIGKIEFL